MTLSMSVSKRQQTLRFQGSKIALYVLQFLHHQLILSTVDLEAKNNPETIDTRSRYLSLFKTLSESKGQ